MSALTSVNTKPMIVLILFFLSSWVLWQMQFAYFRYTAPLQFVMPLVVLAVAFLIIPTSQALVVALIALFILLIPTTEPLDYGRAPWTDNYFQVTIPPTLDLANTQVLIADIDRPVAYFIPFFPVSTQVLRITSNMDSLLYGNEESLLISQLRQELANPRQKFVVYVNDAAVDIQPRINQALAYYDLRIRLGFCHKITSHFLVATLCPVESVP